MKPANLDTFAYIIMHFSKLVKRHEINKLECSLLVQKFQPMFKLKERLLKFIILHADAILSDIRFKKYKLKTSGAEVFQ